MISTKTSAQYYWKKAWNSSGTDSISHKNDIAKSLQEVSKLFETKKEADKELQKKEAQLQKTEQEAKRLEEKAKIQLERKEEEA